MISLDTNTTLQNVIEFSMSRVALSIHIQVGRDEASYSIQQWALLSINQSSLLGVLEPWALIPTRLQAALFGVIVGHLPFPYVCEP